jgi:hypothetical protein
MLNLHSYYYEYHLRVRVAIEMSDDFAMVDFGKSHRSQPLLSFASLYAIAASSVLPKFARQRPL